MLGKLIKYEFKATARIFAPLFAALLAMSLITRLTIGMRLETPHTISMVLSILLIVSAFVITLILTVQRFYKNFMTDEGNLMFTLPVSVDRLIWSKLLVATAWTFVCTVVVFLSLAIMTFSGNELQHLARDIRDLGLPSADLTFFIIEFCALILTSLLASILTIYASMALSQFANTHRVAVSFAVYIGLNSVMQILVTVILSLFANPNMDMKSSVREFFSRNIITAIHWSAAISLLVTVAFGTAMFLVTRYMLKNKLNLQ